MFDEDQEKSLKGNEIKEPIVLFKQSITLSPTFNHEIDSPDFDHKDEMSES